MRQGNPDHAYFQPLYSYQPPQQETPTATWGVRDLLSKIPGTKFKSKPEILSNLIPGYKLWGEWWKKK